MKKWLLFSTILWNTLLVQYEPAFSTDIRDLFNVHSLYQACTMPRESQMFSRCFGYIQGIADLSVGETFCIQGDRLNYAAAIQAFVNWVPNHPEEWDQFQFIGVRNALASVWPCHR